jgi:hypothetical protein
VSPGMYLCLLNSLQDTSSERCDICFRCQCNNNEQSRDRALLQPRTCAHTCSLLRAKIDGGFPNCQQMACHEQNAANTDVIIPHFGALHLVCSHATQLSSETALKVDSRSHLFNFLHNSTLQDKLRHSQYIITKALSSS